MRHFHNRLSRRIILNVVRDNPKLSDAAVRRYAWDDWRKLIVNPFILDHFLPLEDLLCETFPAMIEPGFQDQEGERPFLEWKHQSWLSDFVSDLLDLWLERYPNNSFDCPPESLIRARSILARCKAIRKAEHQAAQRRKETIALPGFGETR